MGSKPTSPKLKRSGPNYTFFLSLFKKARWVYRSFLTLLKKLIPTATKRALSTKNTFLVKTSRTRLVALIGFLQKHVFTQYRSLVDIIVYDNPSRSLRFTVIYNLLSTAFNSRLLVCAYTKDGWSLESLCCLYTAANWLEREVWDLYGVFFKHHPDLRRILTDYGFRHHPLRKDFPLSGHKEVNYCDREKRVLYSTVELPQAYRVFSLSGE